VVETGGLESVLESRRYGNKAVSCISYDDTGRNDYTEDPESAIVCDGLAHFVLDSPKRYTGQLGSVTTLGGIHNGEANSNHRRAC
jgi:hypothetical protein